MQIALSEKSSSDYYPRYTSKAAILSTSVIRPLRELIFKTSQGEKWLIIL